MSDYKDPYREHKACRGCKVLEHTNCDIIDMIANTELTINDQIGFKKCPFREMALRLMKMDLRAGKHYEMNVKGKV